MLTDVVYPLGKGSKLNNEEIRFSLRSLLMRGSNIGKIYVIGQDPGFLRWDERLIHIPYEDGPRPYHNVWGKLLVVAEDDRITERFVWMNDDFYLLKPFDAACIPNLVRGGDLAKIRSNGIRLGAVKMAEITRPYYRVLKHTLAALQSRGLPTQVFSTHQPVNFERSKVRAVYNEFELEMRSPYGLSFRCCYGNYYRLPHVTRPTRIVRQEFNPPNGPLAFASHERVDEAVFLKGIRRMFPTPTPFEIRPSAGV